MPPTRREINVHNSLDEQVACEHFLGKSLAEAEALFRENVSPYQEDLMWMGPQAFRFYIRALLNYMRSEAAATGDAYVISGFIVLVEFRLQYEADEVAPVAEALASSCRDLLARYDLFGVIPAIYGDLRPKLERLACALLR